MKVAKELKYIYIYMYLFVQYFFRFLTKSVTLPHPSVILPPHSANKRINYVRIFSN